MSVRKRLMRKWFAWHSVWDPIINFHMPVRRKELRHPSLPWLEDEKVKVAMQARDQVPSDRGGPLRGDGAGIPHSP